MVNYARIQHHIDKGVGIAAKKLGPPYEALRITSASNGDFPSGWTTITPSVPIFSRRLKGENTILLGLKNTTQWLDIVANMEPYLLGDVFMLIDPAYQAGVSYGPGATSVPGTEEINAIALAWHGPVRVAVGARIDHLVRIFRPTNSPTPMGDGGSYWKQTADTDQPLVLASGSYSFVSGADNVMSASLVPAGVMGAIRRGNNVFEPAVPGMPRLSYFFIYLPPLPGYYPKEGDAIIVEDGARYTVQSPFIEMSGVVGNMLLVDRQISQGGL